ncbi:hypothetical protein CDAR_166531 [Caerostris darwini]|uniref:Uncharacterized protein n=1 Tax=Caerostris darwini TaxID=1538125 RepID=A0AAV4NXJ4_9ARAC|nr:hypothetical protein CDAR_166531 [Caerostris darwini]
MGKNCHAVNKSVLSRNVDPNTTLGPNEMAGSNIIATTPVTFPQYPAFLRTLDFITKAFITEARQYQLSRRIYLPHIQRISFPLQGSFDQCGKENKPSSNQSRH